MPRHRSSCCSTCASPSPSGRGEPTPRRARHRSRPPCSRRVRRGVLRDLVGAAELHLVRLRLRHRLRHRRRGRMAHGPASYIGLDRHPDRMDRSAVHARLPSTSPSTTDCSPSSSSVNVCIRRSSRSTRREPLLRESRHTWRSSPERVCSACSVCGGSTSNRRPNGCSSSGHSCRSSGATATPSCARQSLRWVLALRSLHPCRVTRLTMHHCRSGSRCFSWR